jgi:hypothetical protein
LLVAEKSGPCGGKTKILGAAAERLSVYGLLSEGFQENMQNLAVSASETWKQAPQLFSKVRHMVKKGTRSEISDELVK